MQPEPTYVYVVGESRSGSTVVGRMLAQSNDGVMLGEVARLPELATDHQASCTCGAGVGSCPEWSKALDYLDGQPIRPAKRSGEYSPARALVQSVLLVLGFRTRSARARARRHHGVLELMAHRGGISSYLVDTSKKPDLAVTLVRCTQANVKIVRVRRHGAGIVASVVRRGNATLPRALFRLLLARARIAVLLWWIPANRLHTVWYEDVIEQAATQGVTVTAGDHELGGTDHVSTDFTVDRRYETELPAWLVPVVGRVAGRRRSA